MPKKQWIIYSLIFSVLLLINSPILPAIIPGTLIKTPQGFVPVEQLAPGDHVITHSPHRKIDTAQILHIASHTIDTIYRIETKDAELCVSGGQLFYDSELEQWVKAENLTTQSTLLDSHSNYIPCINVQALNKQTTAYTLSLNYPHTFYISESEVVAHNMDPTFVIEGGRAAAQLAPIIIEAAKIAFVGVITGIGLWQARKQKKNNNFTNFNQTSRPTIPSGQLPEDPDKERNRSKVSNMKEFFTKTAFGREIKGLVKKTRKRVQGQTVYRVTKKNKKLSVTNRRPNLS